MNINSREQDDLHAASAEHRAEGTWDRFIGRAKEAYGDLTDDDVARWNGNLQQAKGWLKQRYGDAEEKLADVWSDADAEDRQAA